MTRRRFISILAAAVAEIREIVLAYIIIVTDLQFSEMAVRPWSLRFTHMAISSVASRVDVQDSSCTQPSQCSAMTHRSAASSVAVARKSSI